MSQTRDEKIEHIQRMIWLVTAKTAIKKIEHDLRAIAQNDQEDTKSSKRALEALSTSLAGLGLNPLDYSDSPNNRVFN